MKTVNLLFLFDYQEKWLIHETFNLIDIQDHNNGKQVICERFGSIYIFQDEQVKFN